MGLFGPTSTFATVVGDLIGFINMLIGVLIPLALVVFFWGLVRYIYEAPHEGHSHARETILWSLIALFLLLSVAGILALLNVAFFGGATNYNEPVGGYTQTGPASGGGLWPILAIHTRREGEWNFLLELRGNH